MDKQQLYHLYQQECLYRVNPPSFETWCKNKEQKEAYYTRQKQIENSPPDEDAWNK
jgi:hypothetical protein